MTYDKIAQPCNVDVVVVNVSEGKGVAGSNNSVSVCSKLNENTLSQ